MFSQALAASSDIIRYEIIVSTCPYIEVEGYLDHKTIQEALKSSLTYVGICKSRDRLRFFCDSHNSVLSRGGNFNVEITVSRCVCVVCQTIMWPDIRTFSSTSQEIKESPVVVPMDNMAYICCSSPCAEILKVNPLPYI